jgi:uncharacterized protein YjbI with pentapeptide repeats
MLVGGWQMDLSSWVSRPSLDTVAISVGMGLLVLALLAAWWWVPKWQVSTLRLTVYDPKASADVEDNFRKTLGQLFGGIAVLLGAAFAYYQAQQTIAETANTRQTSQKTSNDLLISQQVSKGFEQLASSDQLMLRLGGIYELEGVMNNSPQYHRSIVEALCVFVRKTRKDKPDTAVDEDIIAAFTVLARRDITLKDVGVVPLNLGTSLSGTPLFGIRLPGAHLASVNLTRSDLSKADLFGSYLTGADLSGAHLEEANLSDAHLEKANLSGAHVEQAHLSGAHLEEANLSDAHLKGAELFSTRMVSAKLEKADLYQAKLSGAYLSGAHLSGADLTEGDLRGADLSAADMSMAILNKTNLRGADLSGANLSAKSLFQADLSGANLFGAIVAQPALDSACGNAETKLPSRLTVPPC